MPWHYTEMGRLVSQAGSLPWDELTSTYGAMLMEGLTVLGCMRSGRGKQVKALQHLMGYLKNDLSSEDTPKAKLGKQELLGLTIEADLCQPAV